MPEKDWQTGIALCKQHPHVRPVFWEIHVSSRLQKMMKRNLLKKCSCLETKLESGSLRIAPVRYPRRPTDIQYISFKSTGNSPHDSRRHLNLYTYMHMHTPIPPHHHHHAYAHDTNRDTRHKSHHSRQCSAIATARNFADFACLLTSTKFLESSALVDSDLQRADTVSKVTPQYCCISIDSVLCGK